VHLTLKLTAIAMVLAAFGPLAAGVAQLPPGGTFVDDDLTIHQATIEAIAGAGITRGCNPPLNTWFCPNASVTRGQMAAFLVRALQLPDAASAGFTDTINSTFQGDIDRVAAAGITHGCNPPDNDRYCPDRTVSRGQMAAFLARSLDLQESTADRFVDDNGTTFESDIERLRFAGITLGCNPPDNDRYCPTQNVTRAQMATFLARALELDPMVVPPRPILLDVMSREDWGAAPPRGSFTPHEIEQMTIHHAGDLDGATGPTQFLGWQSWHHHLGWPDLAYHFIVGRDGKVYEGRPYTAVGGTATEYDPTGHFLIVVEGNFDESTPNEAQLETLAQMVAWASMQFGIPADTIGGHRDHTATSCPGDNLYAKIHDGTVIARAEAIIASGGVTLNLPDTG
jgi:hypothetical protein